MSMGFLYTTDWEYVTSEDKTYQVLASYSRGKIQLRNKVDGSTMDVQYNCLSAGFGKGYALSISESQLTDSSGGFGPVASNKVFDSFCFPCRGYIIIAGAGLGFLRGKWAGGTGGGDLNIVLFGQVPVFAGVRFWGKFRSTTPSVGFGGGLAHFWLDDG